VAAKLSRGGFWPSGSPAPVGDSLFIVSEDDPADTIRPRLDAADANCRRVHILRAEIVNKAEGRETEVAFDLRNMDLIRDAANRLPNLKFLVIDPIGSFLGGGVDAHRDNEVRSVLEPLKILAADKGFALMLVCHTSKAVVARADDGILGSRAFSGLARSVLHFGPDPTDPGRKLMMPGKCNLALVDSGLAYRIVSVDLPTGSTPKIEWEPDPVAGTADDVFGAGVRPEGNRRGPVPKARDATAEWLVCLLRHGPRAKTDIETEAKSAGVSMRCIRTASDHLGVEKYKSGFAGGWLWRLPEGFQADASAGQDDAVPDAKMTENPKTVSSSGKSSAKPHASLEGDRVLGNTVTFGSQPCQLRNPKPAEVWLVNQLRNGPRHKTEIDDAVKAAGIGGVKAAGMVLQVVITEPRRGRWQWALPVGFDFTPYPAPPEPPEPTLVDEIEPPNTPAEAKPRGKKKRTKAEKQTASGNPAPSGPPSAEQVEVMLRNAKRTWAEVAAHLDELEEYYPTESALCGLTPKQLQLVAGWLAEAEVKESGSS